MSRKKNNAEKLVEKFGFDTFIETRGGMRVVSIRRAAQLNVDGINYLHELFVLGQSEQSEEEVTTYGNDTD